MGLEIRAPDVDDADALGRVHVRAWRAAYTGGLMRDEFLDSLSEAERAAVWRAGLENPPRARATEARLSHALGV
jgi:hypothetical protein